MKVIKSNGMRVHEFHYISPLNCWLFHEITFLHFWVIPINSKLSSFKNRRQCAESVISIWQLQLNVGKRRLMHTTLLPKYKYSENISTNWSKFETSVGRIKVFENIFCHFLRLNYSSVEIFIALQKYRLLKLLPYVRSVP